MEQDAFVEQQPAAGKYQLVAVFKRQSEISQACTRTDLHDGFDWAVVDLSLPKHRQKAT